MNRIIYDCDNTMGLKNYDVDDGLAFLYLLGNSDVEILGVTTTFGNSQTDVVYNNTKELFKDLNIKNIPLLKGAINNEFRESEAAHFLVNMVNKFPNELTLLGTGSLTNFLGAYELDKDFLKKSKRIILMGGITEPLIISGKIVKELNFSIDSVAAYNVLSSGASVTVLTGNICLQANFGEKEFERLKSSNIDIYSYINSKTKQWFNYFMDRFRVREFYNWDVVAAVYLTNPELFDNNEKNINSSPIDLKEGHLYFDSNKTDKGYLINIPTKISDIKRFNEIVFNSWANLDKM